MHPAIALTQFDSESVLENQFHHLEALRGQHVFISGGTGILGAWLLELIKVLNGRYNFGLRATAFSRHASAFAQRWPHLGQQPHVEFVDGDIRYLTHFPSDTRYIIHAAALTDRRLLASQPSSVAEINGIGTLRALRAANLLEDIQKFVLLSSGLIYGNQPSDVYSVEESCAALLSSGDVNSVYAESKRFAESLAQSFISESKLPVVTLRPFAFIGPYQSLSLPWAVTDFIRDSFNGGPVRIMGDGTTVRSVMYASDFAFWVLSALANGRARGTYNVGSPVPMDLAALARMITLSFSPQPAVLSGLGQTGHPRSRLVPNVERAQRDLQVKMTVDISESIRRTIHWHSLTRTP